MRALRHRHRLSGHSCVAAALLAACSVFPEEAVLPIASAGSVGTEGGAPHSEGGAGIGAITSGTGAIPVGGTTASGGSSGGGSSSGAGSGNGGGAGEGGEDVGQAGAGGGVVQTCESPEQYTAKTTLDSWIGSAEPDVNHGDETVLYVSGGSDERRAIFALTVPAAPAGAQLLRAEIVMSIESNADATRAVRQLSLRRLEPPGTVREDKVTWTHFAQGNNEWLSFGGDLKELLGQRTLPPGTTSGLVGFDVTDAVRAALSESTVTYGVAVLETGTAPPAPAQLAFTSRESNASGSPAPELRLSYCPP